MAQMVKNPPAGDLGWIPGLERSPGVGHGNPLQYSCLESAHGQKCLADYIPRVCKESDMTERLNTPPFPPSYVSLSSSMFHLWDSSQCVIFTGGDFCRICLPDCGLLEGKDWLPPSVLCLQHLVQCLGHSRCSMNIC